MIESLRQRAKSKPAGSRRRRHPMNKTGARILGGFLAGLISWVWGGWGAPATGVAMPDAFLTTLGGACIVGVEWFLVRDQRGR